MASGAVFVLSSGREGRLPLPGMHTPIGRRPGGFLDEGPGTHPTRFRNHHVHSRRGLQRVGDDRRAVNIPTRGGVIPIGPQSESRLRLEGIEDIS